MILYPPRHLAVQFSVSGTTIRRWSEVFARHLSPSATAAPRRYTERDVAVMARIKRLSDSGMREKEIDALLGQSEPLPPTEPPTEPQEAPTTALTTFTALLDTLQATQATQAKMADTLAGLADLAALTAAVADLTARVARLESAAHRHAGIVPTRPID